jgi:murein DD-endopeptidase MepM/ murein hydrolase activator NlpD
MARDVAYAFVEAMRPVFDPRRLRSGHPYKLVYGPEGRFRRFEYHVDDDQFLQVASQAGPAPVFEAVLVDYEKELEQVAMRGEINRQNNSLFAAMDAGGGHIEVAMAMAQVFGAEIDFNTELRLGDSFAVLYEQFVRDDVHVTYGDVLAAAFDNDGRQLYGFRFEVPGEAPAYFDAEGRAMKRQFLASPLPFEPRITSRFSRSRMHPILGTARAHQGVDYGAPTGTRVVAIANGTLVSAARSGGSGNMVRLRHTNGYETYYLHLSRFAKGLRPGARIAQGQTIGFVGSTGLATGPHLHFGIRKNGPYVNWLTERRNLPPGDPVPPAHMVAFQEVRDRALAQLTGRQLERGNEPIASNTQ